MSEKLISKDYKGCTDLANEVYQRLRALPSVREAVEQLQKNQTICKYVEKKGGLKQLTALIRQTLQTARENILASEHSMPSRNLADAESFWHLPAADFKEGLWSWLEREVFRRLIVPSNLRRVVNGTGVVLHTNLGRAILAPQVAQFVAEQASSYVNLELDLQTGERGSRYVHVEKLLRELTGAEAAMVVNNNAAAVLLVMNTLALNREVIVSRGELVEVGGSFRIPEVLKAGGARLVEVGTTNKTWLKDYESAVTSETALILKVHTSNYRIEGFTHSVSALELVRLGNRLGIPVVEDLGSGSFFDGADLGFPAEPTIAQTVKAGLDLVTFSGDKLLGGPQAGIIVGKRSFIERLKCNQLTRALRIDKLTLAALEGTLRLYAEQRLNEIPVWRMLTMPLERIREAVDRLQQRLGKIPGLEVTVQEGFSQVGGGAWPTVNIPTWMCGVRPVEGSVMELERFLRLGTVPILARIQKDWVLFDPRTLLEGDEDDIVNRFKEWGSTMVVYNKS